MDSEEGARMRHAVYVYANYLGIDINTEQDLIHIAQRALTELPENW